MNEYPGVPRGVQCSSLLRMVEQAECVGNGTFHFLYEVGTPKSATNRYCS